MNKISANIVADSISIHGDRVTTFLLTFPRFILPELNTHRMFSRNSASSRAIPFEKMVKMVEEDPFIPIAWQKNHKGMQGTEYITDENAIKCLNSMWLDGKEQAIHTAKNLYRGAYKMVADRDVDGNLLRGLVSEDIPDTGVTKQICNRLLEPYMWVTMLITGTEFENFFELRCPKYVFGENTAKPKIWKSKKDAIKDFPDWESRNDLFWHTLNKGQAEIHMMALAEAMYDAMNESTPELLKEGEWHIPFGDQMDEDKIETLLHGPYRASYVRKEGDVQQAKIEIATARCARLSYMTFDGEIDYEKDLKLHDTLLKSHHMSPFEHCARAMSDKEYYSFLKGKFCPIETSDDWYLESFLSTEKDNCGWCRNFKGFIPYRYMIENSI